jgi:hypothetical protein
MLTSPPSNAGSYAATEYILHVKVNELYILYIICFDTRMELPYAALAYVSTLSPFKSLISRQKDSKAVMV